ncbi:hypothetical protein MIT9_P0435 [Methylomarinovum caldicuralii]|uniref:Carbohydrate kinase PfkB domain-containing protein n=1 Tax=Methylomarinovum caldicuralii TaxID=438856 RepID=A0AAU9CSH2_9GAMM|nr:hypothetical protein [Methylomarinovum caldicuralii]BCX80857.1 hypothetical protein MIT9_P0435 [Methylomarinovum caldicuralii]
MTEQNASATPLTADIPQSLSHVVKRELDDCDVVSTSIECGTVEDIRIEVPDTVFRDAEQKVNTTRSPSIQEKIAQGIPKLPARSIDIVEQGGRILLTVTSDDDRPVTLNFSFPKGETEIHRGLGGGAFNTTVDSAIINLALCRALGLPEQNLPKAHLYLTLPEDQADQVRKQAEPFPNLDIIWVDGKPRRSVFIKNKDSGEEIYFSTPYGEINPKRPIPSMRTPRFLLLHNQPDDRIFWDVAVRVRNDLKDHSVVWSVGSNQIRDGIDPYASPIGVCETMTLNLGEALAWIRKSSSSYIRDDDVLLRYLEEYHNGEPTKSGAGRVSFVRLFGIFKTELQQKEKTLVLPEDPIKRRIVAQRCADILHRFGVKESVFITDGGNPTIASFKYEDKKEGVRKKVQYYIPIIDKETGERIDRIIQEAGCDISHKDATGCGDSYTATVLALKQITGNHIYPTTIAILANHIARLVYALPFSNLMEIEAYCPGVTEKVLRLALENLDELNARCCANNKLELLQSQARSLIFQVLR